VNSLRNEYESTALYREEQRFQQRWLFLLLGTIALVVTSLFAYAMFKQLVQGQPWGDRPMSDTELVITGPIGILLGWGVLLLLRWMKLVVEVRESGIVITFRPFVHREILFGDIKSCEARTYRPLWEYGGWGIRFSTRGMAYNVSGNRGVQLELLSGKRILIGSQHAEELARVMQAQILKNKRG
jgi:hypothetical protein